MNSESSETPRVQVTMAWVSPRVNRAEPCDLGRKPTSHATGLISSNARPSSRLPSPRMVSRVISLVIDPKIALTQGVFSSVSSAERASMSFVPHRLDGVALLELAPNVHRLDEFVRHCFLTSSS